MSLIKVCGINKELKNYQKIDMVGFHFIDGSIDSIEPSKCSAIDTPYSTLRVGVFGKKDNTWNWKELYKGELADIILQAKTSKMNAIQIHGTCDFQYLKQFGFLTILYISDSTDIPIMVDTYIDYLLIENTVLEYIDIKNIRQNFLISMPKWTINIHKEVQEYQDHQYYCGVNLESYTR